MNTTKITFLVFAILTLTNCASGYKIIDPKAINYVSTNESNGVKLEYKYDLSIKNTQRKN